ncbi:hypothetical protein [Paraburkholderia terrae]
MKLRERDIEIDFTDAIDSLVFDQMRAEQPNYHGIGEMHRVDFIVELDEAILFVEVKDPGNPKAQEKGLKKFRTQLNDGTLSSTFASKFIDSFFYRWAENRLSKTVHYLSLVTLEGEVLPNFSDEIAKKLPPAGKTRPDGKGIRCRTAKYSILTLGTKTFPSGRSLAWSPSL